jgi:hypothetical protein
MPEPNFSPDCRGAFVRYIKKQEQFSEQWAKSSLRAHWAGPQDGFHDMRVQEAYKNFAAGWAARSQAEK